MEENKFDKVRLLLVDDHPLYRRGIAMTLKQDDEHLEVVAEAGTLKEAIEALESHKDIDLVLLDLQLPDGNGKEVVRYVGINCPATKVLVLSVDLNPHHITALIEMGINGFVSKEVQSDELLEAIHAVVSGFGYYGKGINAMMEEVATAEGEDLNEILTAREIEILRFCAQGFSAKEIAERLQLSVRTVEGHKNHIYGKMGFESIGELVKYAFTHGIITA